MNNLDKNIDNNKYNMYNTINTNINHVTSNKIINVYIIYIKLLTV